MRIYIIEDDSSVISILEDIIEGENLGSVCGSTEDGRVDMEEVLALSPDLILIDLLMPEKDGIQWVKELKERGSASKFIMISQVSAKDLVAKAYQAGVELFIQKPINIIEIRQVVGNVAKQIENERKLETIQSMFATGVAQPAASPKKQELSRQRIQHILSLLGMAGEKGAQDIVQICLILLQRHESVSQVGLGTLCAQLSESPKSMEQRIRRAVERGMYHLASLGVEDYANEYFTRYASRLFSFQEVRAEMAFIQGKGQRGKVNLKKFLDGLLILIEEYV